MGIFVDNIQSKRVCEKTGFLFSALNRDTRKPMTSEDLSGDAAFPIADYYAPFDMHIAFFYDIKNERIAYW